jgi:hypothetical protein
MERFPGSRVRSTVGSIWLSAPHARRTANPPDSLPASRRNSATPSNGKRRFLYVVTFAVLALSEFDPLAALQLSLEWGHDTDSYAQLVGAFIGARHGAALFPVSLSAPVLERLRADYAVDLDDWVQLLAELRRQSSTRPLFPEAPATIRDSTWSSSARGNISWAATAST